MRQNLRRRHSVGVLNGLRVPATVTPWGRSALSALTGLGWPPRLLGACNTVVPAPLGRKCPASNGVQETGMGRFRARSGLPARVSVIPRDQGFEGDHPGASLSGGLREPTLSNPAPRDARSLRVSGKPRDERRGAPANRLGFWSRRRAKPWGSTPHPGAALEPLETFLEVNGRYPESAPQAPPAERITRTRILGRLRARGAVDLSREASVLKVMLRRYSAEEIWLALDGLERIFPKQPISLRMIHGKAMIGGYRGFQSAVNAAIKAQERRADI